MNTDILMPIITISGIAVAAGYMLNVLGKAQDDKFDERQLIERGRGANLAMTVAMVYIVGFYGGIALEMIRQEYMMVYPIYGLVVTLMVFDGHCIFHDACLNREQDLAAEVLKNGLFGTVWLIMVSLEGSRMGTVWGSRWGTEYVLIHGAPALVCLSRSVLLLLRSLVLRIRDRREDEGEKQENADE